MTENEMAGQHHRLDGHEFGYPELVEKRNQGQEELGGRRAVWERRSGGRGGYCAGLFSSKLSWPPLSLSFLLSSPLPTSCITLVRFCCVCHRIPSTPGPAWTAARQASLSITMLTRCKDFC